MELKVTIFNICCFELLPSFDLCITNSWEPIHIICNGGAKILISMFAKFCRKDILCRGRMLCKLFPSKCWLLTSCLFLVYFIKWKTIIHSYFKSWQTFKVKEITLAYLLSFMLDKNIMWWEFKEHWSGHFSRTHCDASHQSCGDWLVLVKLLVIIF